MLGPLSPGFAQSARMPALADIDADSAHWKSLGAEQQLDILQALQRRRQQPASSAGCADVEAAGDSAATSLVEPWSLIPHRLQQVQIGWFFVLASAALQADFAALQTLVRMPEGDPGHFAELTNWLAVFSCLCWFFGFICLAHWMHSVGSTKLGLAGCYLKLMASVLFNLGPMTGTMNDPAFGGGVSRGGGTGLWWSNLVGIVIFHTGNVVSCVDFWLQPPAGADARKGWFKHGNLPVTSMWIYQAATWFLVLANLLVCNFDGAAWAPLLPIQDWKVLACQAAGSELLLIASLMCVAWSDGFVNFAHAKAVR